MSRESAGLAAIARGEARAMRCVGKPCEKNQARDLRGRTRRCGAGCERKSTTIAQGLTRTDLARALFDRGHGVRDRGASAEDQLSAATPQARVTVNALRMSGSRPTYTESRR
jgi:hypothetical protein